MFKELNSAQWLWYYQNYIKDQEEKFELNRDMIEYHASFIEPEAVRKIRNAREKTIEVSNDQFTSGIEQIFGRSINGKMNKPKEQKIQRTDINKILTAYKVSKVENIPKVNYKDWADIKLER